jgi:hypothetical protein
MSVGCSVQGLAVCNVGGAGFAEVAFVKIDQSVFTSLVLGLICDSEARTAIGSGGQHICTSQELPALNTLRELSDIT